MPGLSDYKQILVAHQQEFWDSKGYNRQAVVEDAMKEMVAHSEGTLDRDFLKGLDLVSS